MRAVAFYFTRLVPSCNQRMIATDECSRQLAINRWSDLAPMISPAGHVHVNGGAVGSIDDQLKVAPHFVEHLRGGFVAVDQ